MNLTKQQKILIGGGTAVFILVIIAVIIFIIIKHNNKSKSSDQCTWSSTEWSPSPCTSGGTQTRVVSCKNTEGGDCNTCKDAKPSDNQPCSVPDQCSWQYGPWNPDKCSSGVTQQTRNVTCTNSKGTCADTSCTDTKPTNTNICKLHCCNKTTWTCILSSDSATCPSGTSQIYDCASCTDFPNNVYIFYPGDDNSTQQIIYKIFSTQGGSDTPNNGQNSKLNYAFLFMPGVYNLKIPIGFYTHVAGLGKTNDQVIINDGPRVDNGAKDYRIGALNTFWRTCENMTVNPQITLPGDTQPSMIYAVSQSCSLRSVKVNGILHLGAIEDSGGMGFASGGFMANCNIKYDLNMGSQQQFICRNTEYGSFPIFIWNQVNVGCKSDNERGGCCINTTEPQISSSTLTVVNQTPSVKEKPYLAHDDDDGIVVLCPGLSNKTTGNTSFSGTTITNANYKIVTDTITVTALNSFLSNADIKCIIFSPGRYNIDSPINLNGQLLFGLGLPVLTSTQNNNIITGYGSICGIIFDAGYSTIGNPQNNILVNLTDNPSYLWDIVCRVGGSDDHAHIYQVDTILYIGGDNSILDNVWCWVADHYADDNTHVGWEKAICQTGVHVTGNNVIAYGLFAEHTRNRNVLWEGNNGEVYMFQSEFNYFPPLGFDTSDFVSYEVTNSVTNHTLKGAGAYSFFPNTNTNPNPTTMALAGFKFADVGKIDYENLTTVFLNGYGGIKYVFYDEITGGFGQTVKRDPKTIQGDTPKTQVSVICNKDKTDICSCPSTCHTTASCDTSQGRCKPNNNACTVDQMKGFGPCTSDIGIVICPNIPSSGCYPKTTPPPSTCTPCLWW